MLWIDSVVLHLDILADRTLRLYACPAPHTKELAPGLKLKSGVHCQRQAVRSLKCTSPSPQCLFLACLAWLLRSLSR